MPNYRTVNEQTPTRGFGQLVLNYTVFPGNGPQVIRDAMTRRSQGGRVVWKEVSKDAVMFQSDVQVNFIWKPTSLNYKLQQVVDKVNSEAAEK